ncbi:hypothetical protein LSUCC0031_05605 [Rhodobacterales bacterium LSUCC0031]|nr:hypothetical protein [Rhodobacterales bacterium LSUCC0031]
MADPPIATRAGYNGPPRGLEAQDGKNRLKSTLRRDMPPHAAGSAGVKRGMAYIGVLQRQEMHWK